MKNKKQIHAFKRKLWELSLKAIDGNEIDLFDASLALSIVLAEFMACEVDPERLESYLDEFAPLFKKLVLKEAEILNKPEKNEVN